LIEDKWLLGLLLWHLYALVSVQHSVNEYLLMLVLFEFRFRLSLQGRRGQFFFYLFP
jgi:hypothetical protein